MIPPEWTQMGRVVEIGQRFARANRRMTPGSFGGRTESSSPAKEPAIVPPSNVQHPSGKEYATFVVAASNSTDHGKASADYVCDGTADDVEINAALAAADPGIGAGVLLLEGFYSLAASITLNQFGQGLRGQGFGTYIKAAVGVPGISFAGGANYMSVTRLTVVNGSRCIDMSGAGLNPVVDDVSVSAPTQVGIYGGGTQPHIVRCRVLSCTSVVGIQATPTSLVGMCVIRNGSAGTGILISGSDYASVLGNHIYGVRTGVRITGDSNHNNVQMNLVRYVTATGGYGIDIDDALADANLVTNNDLHLGGSLGSFRDLGTGTITTAGNRL